MTNKSILDNTSISRESIQSILGTLNLANPDQLTLIVEKLREQNLQPALAVVRALKILIQLKANLESYCSNNEIELTADDPTANELRDLIQLAYLDLEDAIIALRTFLESPTELTDTN